uniref:Uncharacterized protein n=1 Tax=Enterobacter cloacae TaxID=550 RepID=A0A0H3ZHM7_ENTCL|nr:hypothetical protein [Enterobacter cloacae]AKN35408.1 hypothetical protein [Enterobacter cloacae]AKN35458.1 hypothetical protein [Enterobacter cloacae]AKN35492.1 hypothetical protein [Enterobacter cloacae]AOW71219.1 hypothetical protein [Enterobacter cloacae]
MVSQIRSKYIPTTNEIQNGIHCGLQPAFHRPWCLMKWDTKLTYRSGILFYRILNSRTCID